MPAYDSSSLADFECTRSAFSSPTCSFCPRENGFSCGCARVRIALLRAHNMLVLPSPGAQKIGVSHRAGRGSREWRESERNCCQRGVHQVSPCHQNPAKRPARRSLPVQRPPSPRGTSFFPLPRRATDQSGSKHFLNLLAFVSKQTILEVSPFNRARKMYCRFPLIIRREKKANRNEGSPRGRAASGSICVVFPGAGHASVRSRSRQLKL